MIRQERPEDAAAIASVIEEAFADHPHSNHTEHRLVEALRTAGALAASLVAVEDGEVVGHIAFSRVSIGGTDSGWMIMAPLAVRTARQRQGIGQALVRVGLEAIRIRGASGCVLVGDPAYYGRFGFAPRPGLAHKGVPPEYVLAFTFGDPIPAGDITCHPAFAACI